MQKLSDILMPVVYGAILLAASACAAASTDQTQTAGQLSEVGKTIFTQRCVKCHGENGQKVNGSALMGPDNVLANYQTGQGLYDYISKFMPDDAPGSLSPAQYLQVESFLLLQDGYVKADTPVELNNLERILLVKP